MNFALPIGFATLTWWISTVMILWLINRPQAAFPRIARGATALMVAATVGIIALRGETGTAAAYIGFALGIVSWGWHEVMFLLGFVSGPRKGPCPPNLSIKDRFLASAEAVLHHEAGILLHAVVLTLCCLGAENWVAAYTFYVLWGMRISAKLLVFFGAPNVADHFLPSHIAYLGTYFRKSANGPAAVIALTATSAAVVTLAALAGDASPGAFSHAVLLLLTTLGGLAVIEHIALVVRLPDEALWGWVTKPAGSTSPTKIQTRSRRQ